MKCLKLFILTKLDLLSVSSNSLQGSRADKRTLTMIQVVGGCKVLEIRETDANVDGQRLWNAPKIDGLSAAH